MSEEQIATLRHKNVTHTVQTERGQVLGGTIVSNGASVEAQLMFGRVIATQLEELELRMRMAEHQGFGLNLDNVQILDSSVPGYRRRELVDPKVRDTVKVFLMTSSGARGVSFPLTDWIVASVPRFNVEAALMEIAQLIYRGRGMYTDETGAKVSGDRVPRHLVMLVDDYVVSDGEMDKRQWLRQSLDLMTLLVMLRSTIYTRITGDAGLKQPLALVPVGAVGTEELISLMSQHVAEFVKEAGLQHA
ncbi:hypothetical protein [Comamonas aquatica]|uniref:hypothetical protein n=1 Tax=Comamonas aquatica TaxID=225991 RepID=UPI0031E25889